MVNIDLSLVSNLELNLIAFFVNHMNKVNRLLFNVITDQLAESASFYTKHFDFEVDYESDWFIHLISKDKIREIGFINPTSEVVPNGIDEAHKGSYLTFVVDNVDTFYASL